MNSRPPKYFLRFFRWFCHPRLQKPIEGDLMELYDERIRKMGKRKADLRFRLDVLQLFRPSIIKPADGTYRLNSYCMFKHNLLISFRGFKRFKSTFFINLLGLSSGLASAFLVYLWINDEMYMNKFHIQDDQLYQVMGNYHQEEGITTWNGTSAMLAGALKSEFPEIKLAISATDPDWNINFHLLHEDNRLKAVGRFCGEDFFKMFSYNLIQGHSDQVLARDNIVLSKSLALRLFNTTENIIGKKITWKSLNLESSAIVSGIFEDPPSNGTAQFDFILPFSQYKKDFGEDWNNPNSITYALLKKGVDLPQLTSKMEGLIKTKVEGSNKTLFLQKFSEGYLYNKYENGKPMGGRIEYINLFSAIGIFILIIAGINFMNLSTARASRRIKEIGIKKTVGALKRGLVFQYLNESLIITFLSAICAMGIVFLLLPSFNLITGKDIAVPFELRSILILLLITVITGVLAGSYPAFYLSNFKPAAILKGNFRSSSSTLWVRKGLTIFQFTISIVFIVSVFVIFNQMKLIHEKGLGFDKEHIIYFEREGKSVESLDLFLSELKSIRGVVNASAINNDFFRAPSETGLTWDGNTEEETRFGRYIVYYDFIETIGLKLKGGRTFSKEFSSEDHFEIILNESAAKLISNPIGKKVKLWGQDTRIVGVVEDFHFRSLHEK